MPVSMTPRQREFWCELLQPFTGNELSVKPGGGKQLTWVDARAVMTRLDNVCGQGGWTAEYRQTPRGYTCRLGIACPDSLGGVEWLFKEDGAGFEEMGAENRKTGEFEYDVDNDEKSAYTNAFRRAASAWGLARHLYPKAGSLHVLCGEGVPTTQRPSAAPTRAAATPARKEYAAEFNLPTTAKSIYPIVKRWEEHFKVQFTPGLDHDAQNLGLPRNYSDWPVDQIAPAISGLVAYAKTLENYAGEFNHLDLPTAAKALAAADARPAPSTDAGLLDAKKALVVAIKGMIRAETGSPATDEGVRVAIKQLSVFVGRPIATTLRDCDDAEAISLMARAASGRIDGAMASRAEEARDDIPF